MLNLKPGYRPQPAVPLPTTAPRSVQVLSLREPSHAACGLDAEAAAARLALAPPSVQAFIKRWGHRSGIDDAYTATCSPRYPLPASSAVPVSTWHTWVEIRAHCRCRVGYFYKPTRCRSPGSRSEALPYPVLGIESFVLPT